MIRVLQERVKAGVDVRIIGKISGRSGVTPQKLTRMRLHTRTIIRDGRQAFVGSQSLRPAELDSRRELGLIVRDAKIVKKLLAIFESDWSTTSAAIQKEDVQEKEMPEAAKNETEKALAVLIHELQPLSTTVKRAVKKVAAQTGAEALPNKMVKSTVKKVVKKAVKQAVRAAARDARKSARLKNQPWAIRLKNTVYDNEAATRISAEDGDAGNVSGDGWSRARQRAGCGFAIERGEKCGRFQRIVGSRASVHQAAQLDRGFSLPALKPTDQPEKIANHQQALAQKIREARQHARRGDMFPRKRGKRFAVQCAKNSEARTAMALALQSGRANRSKRFTCA